MAAQVPNEASLLGLVLSSLWDFSCPNPKMEREVKIGNSHQELWLKEKDEGQVRIETLTGLRPSSEQTLQDVAEETLGLGSPPNALSVFPACTHRSSLGEADRNTKAAN